MLPQMKVTIETPANLEGLADRHHNRLIKQALRQVLEEHHRKRIPLHFKADNRTKYQHMDRTPKYRRAKMRRFHSRTDLVKTGRTRDKMLSQYQLRIGGSASGSKTKAPGVHGQLIMRFPFPANYSRSGTHVDVAQMILEISRWTDQEANETSRQFLEIYTQSVNDLIKSSPRIKRTSKGAP